MEAALSLTLLGTIFAIYTILPEHKKIKAISSFGKSESLIIVYLAILMILSLIFGIFVSIHSNKNEQFIFEFTYIFLTIIILLLTLNYFFYGKLKNKIYFLDKVDELLNEKKYASILALLDENYKDVFNFKKKEENNDFFDFSSLYNVTENKLKEDNQSNMKNKSNSLIEIIISTIFSTKNNKEESNYIFVENLKFKILNNAFVKHNTIIRPFFGLKLIKDERFDLDFRKRYAKLFFSNLLMNNESILYHEIANLSEISYEKYKTSSDYKILHNIFDNIQFANEIAVYKPIGDFMLKILENHYLEEFDDYNKYNERFIDQGEPDEEIYSDPIFIGIQFFNIMIKEAIYQKSDFHMWLYYYYNFVSRICQNYDDKNANLNEEFPNKYSYFLYNIISNLIEWIKIPTKLNNDIIPIEDIDCRNDENNIIKDAILCLCQCNQEILKTEKVPFENKKLFVNKIFKLYLYLILSNDSEVVKYGKVLECCLLDGPVEYIKSLKNILDKYDRPSLRGGSRSGMAEAFDKLGEKLNEKFS